ncbi:MULTISPECIES: PstS family phosphate ABC transporter substrate-binding protein [unclassified Agarivorans]|uniref:PstS family phosphate ABC transporter substrate-binding protein n=1 Tax=unclassified Agarivorans TaxID=2636026 RepID=UPI0026E2A6BD|nr:MULTISPECIES: substrate-binding domain-containing protein [unclassified Agarivorans]MDO6685982.1 substrate-binding domain-containing protein [Agarivorans sp. 3_MG-2023]MDO6713880.1 substrate-binding domain-containing protein [Agarivorans sp. 2_MG-2023]
MKLIHSFLWFTMLITYLAQADAQQRILVEHELVEPMIELIKSAELAEQLGIIKTTTVSQSFIEGKGRVGISSQRWLDSDMAEFVKRYGYQPIELFFSSDAAAILVHRDNPINAIDMASLEQIFACQTEATTLNWNTINTSYANSPIQRYAVSEELDQHRKFNELVACSDGKQNAATQVSTSQLLSTLDKQIDAIAYTLYQNNFDQAKALQLIDKQGDYFDLNHETILSGRYPLANVYYMYLNVAPNGNYSHSSYRQFVQYVQTDDAQQRMLKYGFIPLPEEALHRNLVTLQQTSPEIAGGYK